jgi:rRNA maturation endonuclease Nob1
MTGSEVYKLQCGGCGEDVTLPATDGQHACPRCGAALRIHWNAERHRFARGGEQ